MFSRFWIIFTIIILNSFSGTLPISSSFVWFGGHLSCFFTCWVFLCFFFLFRLLCLGWPFSILAVCGSSLLWRFLAVDGIGRLACQDFLFREAFVSVLVGGTGFLLSGVQWTVLSSEFGDVYGFSVTLGSLYIEFQGYVPALLENLRGLYCSATCWLLGGAWFPRRYGGFWMSSYQLMFPEVRSSLVFSGFGLKPPASGFQSYSYSSLKTSPFIQHQW